MQLPKQIREHFARVAGYMQKEDTPSALDTLVTALREVNTLQTQAQRRIFIQQFDAHVQKVLTHPRVMVLIGGQASQCVYREGREGGLSTLLRELSKILRQTAPEKAIAAQQEGAERRERLQALLDKGQQAIAQGELGIARGCLERAAAEFADNVTVLEHVGQQLFVLQMYHSAGRVFARAVDVAPKIMENYSKAIDAFVEAEQYRHAEALFQKALRQFGGHQRTYARMARMYYLWEKKEKALEFVELALERDSEEPEALAVLQLLRA